MLKLERSSDGERIIVRLIGRVRSEHLGEITAQMGEGGPRVALDLEEVTIVDVEVVRFLGACEREGTQLLDCPPYVREWISREGERP
jgi:hypothetical protein